MWREGAEAKEQCNQTRVLYIVKDQLLGEGQSLNLQSQMQVDTVDTVQCRLVALRAWGQGAREKIYLLHKITQSAGEVYTGFLQRSTSAVHRAIADPYVRQVLIKSLAFENTATEY